MAREFKTVPNQKVVKVNKEICDEKHLYAKINLDAMGEAAKDLQAGAFKLWCYFAKNQQNHEFALSSAAAERDFGLKKKQYDNAINELTEKGYLVVSKGNNYIFNETSSVVSKGNNDVVSKGNNDVVSFGNNALYPKDTRNITEYNNNTTYNITVALAEANDNVAPSLGGQKPKAQFKF